MVKIKTLQEIEIMREAGKIAARALKKVLEHVHEGITTLELDKIAFNEITKNNAKPSFQTVDDYQFTTCININHGIVHGLPNSYKLKKGDLVSVDLGAYYKGFHSDLSYTVEVETNYEENFLQIGKVGLENAIFQAKAGNFLGDISYEMQKTVELGSYTVSKDLVGHGIGTELHEDPYVPCFGKPKSGLKLREGMVLALEIIYQKGSPELVLSSDGWTLETADKSLSALFEHTVAILADGPEILTI